MIAERIHPDNDVDIVVSDLPTGLTVTWFASGSLSATATAAHVDVSGSLAYSDGAYRGVLEGSAITARLLPTLSGKAVYIYVRVGSDLRVVGQTTLDPNRLVA